MDAKIQTELEKAKEYFYQWRLVDAYAILRRHFDRLPFKPESTHAEYIGMFVRTLFELGKNRELQFYLNSLETLYEKTEAPEIGYQLAYVYLDDQNPRIKRAIEILEKIIHSPEMRPHAAKAKILLAHCYDIAFNDLSSVKKIINSVEVDPSDKALCHILETWKAYILRQEGHYQEAEDKLLTFLNTVSAEESWYANFTARIILANLYLETKEVGKARKVVEEFLKLAEGKPMKSMRRQIQRVEDKLLEVSTLEPIHLKETATSTAITCFGKTILLDQECANDRLLYAFLKEKVLKKEAIIQSVFDRNYKEEDDDAVVYSLVHSLRKHFKKIGLPQEVIVNDRDSYRLLPEVKGVEGKL